MNKKNILYTCFIFFVVTILFQVTILIKLNGYDNKISRITKKIAAHTQPSEQPQETTSANADTEQPETTINPSSDLLSYKDMDEVLGTDNLAQILTGCLFVGDSRTEGLYKFTPAADYADFCCGPGYNITTILKKNLTDSIVAKGYKNIFLCLGYNELGWDYPDTFIERYKQLIQDIKNTAPDTHIYIIGILNVCQEGNSLESYENNERISMYNNLISDMCQSNQITYLDFNKYFIDLNGNLNPISTEDGIHFTAKYYNYYLYWIIKSIDI